MGTDNNLQILQQPESAVLFNDVCLIIDQARRHVATYVNVEACLMNWHVGKRIKEDVLYNQRAEYGKQILKNLSVKLTERYGTGWGTEKLKHCVRSAYLFSEDDIMYAARTQLTWTHLRSLMSLKDSLERQFYMEMCRIEHWDTRTLDEKIDSQLYQRTAISQRPEEVIRRELKELREEDTLNPDIVFRSSEQGTGAVRHLSAYSRPMPHELADVLHERSMPTRTMAIPTTPTTIRTSTFTEDDLII